MKISIYVASRFAHHPEARKVRDQLVAAGFDVTSRWLEGEPSLESKLSDERRRELAEMDVYDVKRARCLVLYNPVDSAKVGTGGCHYECGIASAMGMPIFVLGPRTNIFHWRENVQTFPNMSVEDMIVAIRYIVKPIRGHGEGGA